MRHKTGVRSGLFCDVMYTYGTLWYLEAPRGTTAVMWKRVRGIFCCCLAIATTRRDYETGIKYMMNRLIGPSAHCADSDRATAIIFLKIEAGTQTKSASIRDATDTRTNSTGIIFEIDRPGHSPEYDGRALDSEVYASQ